MQTDGPSAHLIRGQHTGPQQVKEGPENGCGAVRAAGGSGHEG